MKKIIFGVSLFLSTLVFSNSPPFYTYTDIQAMAGYPMVGGGIRFKNGRTSLDFSGNVLPINGFSPIIFHSKVQLLFFPLRGVYLGAGLGVLNEPESIKGITGSLEGSMGLEWRTRRGRHFFLEASAIAPQKKPTGNMLRVWPSLTFGYGF